MVSIYRNTGILFKIGSGENAAFQVGAQHTGKVALYIKIPVKNAPLKDISDDDGLQIAEDLIHMAVGIDIAARLGFAQRLRVQVQGKGALTGPEVEGLIAGCEELGGEVKTEVKIPVQELHIDINDIFQKTVIVLPIENGGIVPAEEDRHQIVLGPEEMIEGAVGHTGELAYVADGQLFIAGPAEQHAGGGYDAVARLGAFLGTGEGELVQIHGHEKTARFH